MTGVQTCALPILPTVGGFQMGKHWQLWMGSFIVLVVIGAPRGVLGLLQRQAGDRDA